MWRQSQEIITAICLRAFPLRAIGTRRCGSSVCDWNGTEVIRSGSAGSRCWMPDAGADDTPGRGAGCRRGRYPGRWRLPGAGRALGADIPPPNLATGTRRASAARLTDIDFTLGNVLAMDVPDGSYDIVFSNGVLHHTKAWKTGV